MFLSSNMPVSTRGLEVGNKNHRLKKSKVEKTNLKEKTKKKKNPKPKKKPTTTQSLFDKGKVAGSKWRQF